MIKERKCSCLAFCPMSVFRFLCVENAQFIVRSEKFCLKFGLFALGVCGRRANLISIAWGWCHQERRILILICIDINLQTGVRSVCGRPRRVYSGYIICDGECIVCGESVESQGRKAGESLPLVAPAARPPLVRKIRPLWAADFVFCIWQRQQGPHSWYVISIRWSCSLWRKQPRPKSIKCPFRRLPHSTMATAPPTAPLTTQQVFVHFEFFSHKMYLMKY